MSKSAIITEIKSLPAFAQLLQSNPGLIIIKFGATWCAPCKRLEKQVYKWFEKLPKNVQCVIVDVDVSIDVYSFLKKKKMINGIPAILCYTRGNLNYVPDDMVIGADPQAIEQFFNKWFYYAIQT